MNSHDLKSFIKGQLNSETENLLQGGNACIIRNHIINRTFFTTSEELKKVIKTTSIWKKIFNERYAQFLNELLIYGNKYIHRDFQVRYSMHGKNSIWGDESKFARHNYDKYQLT